MAKRGRGRGSSVGTGGGDYTGGDRNPIGGANSEVVGRDKTTNVYIASEAFLRQLVGVQVGADLEQATQKYFAFLLDRYTYLMFKGLGVNEKAWTWSVPPPAIARPPILSS